MQMDGPTSPPGDALQAATTSGAVIGTALSFGPSATDGMSPVGFVPDSIQMPGRGHMPIGGDAYSQTSPGFMIGSTVRQRPISPVIGMDLTQMMKLSEAVPSTQMGMLGYPGMPKKPPKPAPPANTPHGGISPDSRPGRTEESQARLPHTLPASCGSLVTAPGGLGLRRGCGSASSSTVSSSASGSGSRGTAGRNSTTTPSRSTINRRISTPLSRPLPSGVLGTTFHTEYREQMSPSWWLGAAACSSSWLQLAPPPEVMELVEKKKLTEQFKTVEGLIDRADYLGALRLQADRRNVLHFLALDEQEMQTYLWQPRFPRIIDLRKRTGNVATRPTPRPTDHLVDPKHLWLRFLTISPPLYSTATPILTGPVQKPQGSEGPGNDLVLPASSATLEPQDYCLGSSGEHFLPILFDDSGGAADFVPPEELLVFEEDALREVAGHIEGKLTHALTCMLFAARARVNASAAKRKQGRLAFLPLPPGGTAVEEECEGVEVSSQCSGTNGRVKRLRPADEGHLTDTPGRPPKSASMQSLRSGTEACSSPQACTSSPATQEIAAHGWGMQLPPVTGPSTVSGGVVIGLEDLVATYGTAPCLIRHVHCFQQD